MKKVMKVVAALMLMTAAVCVAGCNKPDDPNNGDSGNGGNGGGNGSDLIGHEYVDLGLPSGTLWATCNLGSYTPEGYGDYFAWGETEWKESYNWRTYRHCINSVDALTKYCNDSDWGYNGFTDNLTTLEPCDDAATANWGNGWRMPTHEEWVELSLYTTITRTARNGINGMLFTAKNGEELFLPAAGNWDDNLGSGLVTGYCGCYWSSSLSTSGINPTAAWYYFFDSYYTSANYSTYRCRGISVRPVRVN